jgi:hypothetical protein
MIRLKIIGVLLALVAAAGLFVVRPPSPKILLDDMESELKAVLRAHSVHIDPAGNDMLRHRLAFALGDKHQAADPDPESVSPREYVKKVKPIGRAAKKSGGCG